MEKKRIIIQILTIIAFLFFPYIAKAERMPPKEVKPVEYKGVRFTVPHEHMGYILAFNLEGGLRGGLPLDIKIYDVKHDPQLERDVQGVFITSMDIKGDKLIVINENSERFEIDLTEIVMSSCHSACIKQGFSRGECLAGGSALMKTGGACQMAGGEQPAGRRNIIIKSCNRECIGSWDECCCFK